MIDRNNHYHGFTTTESIDADKVVEYLDDFSLRTNSANGYLLILSLCKIRILMIIVLPLSLIM